MKNTSFYILALCAILGFSACEKAILDPQPANTKQAIFEQVWKFADEKYSFFDLKKIDWAKVKTQYQAKVSENMTDAELFKVCGDMLYELKDGHVNLRSDFDRSRNWSWFLNYAPNFDKNLIERNYYKDKQKFVGAFEYFDFGDVAYVYYGSFSDGFSKENLDFIVNEAKNKKGIIIDIRDNGGGASDNIPLLAERFCAAKTKIGEDWAKNGVAHDAFEKNTTYLAPNADVTKLLDKPVVVLTNRHVYSAATFFSYTMKQLPNVTLIGDTGGGGGGVPTYTELSNGWILRASSTQTFDNQGFNIEQGVPPTIKIDMDDATTKLGKDAILERGLKFIREK